MRASYAIGAIFLATEAMMARNLRSLGFKTLFAGAACAAFFASVSVLPATAAPIAASKALRADDGQIVLVRAGRGGGGRGGGYRGGGYRGGGVHRGYRGGVG